MKLDGDNVIEFHKLPEFQQVTLKVLRREERDTTIAQGKVALCLAREDDEHRLGDLLRLMRIVRVPQRNGMNQPDVTPHQLTECVLEPIPDKLVDQVTVWNELHSLLSGQDFSDNDFSPVKPVFSCCPVIFRFQFCDDLPGVFHRQLAVFHLMNEGRTVFAQLLDFLPKYEFDKCVARYHGNFRVRKLPTYEQFLVLAFAQLTWRESLRDIETCLASFGPKLYHAGIRQPTARNTLADANENRDWQIGRAHV